MPPRRPPPIRSLAEAAAAISLLWDTAFARQQVQVGGDLTGRPETPTLNPNAAALKHTLLGPRHTDTVTATPATGALVVGSGSSWTKLPVGSTGQVLTVGIGGALGWATGGGGGGGAPTNASYLTLGTDATLTDERVFAHSARLSHTDGGAGGNYTLDLGTSGVTAGSYTYASVTVDTYGRVTSASNGTAPITSHTGLSDLTWASSGHVGAANSVAAWGPLGAAQSVQATADETMLVRRAGILQWVPLVVGMGVLAARDAQPGPLLTVTMSPALQGSIV